MTMVPCHEIPVALGRKAKRILSRVLEDERDGRKGRVGFGWLASGTRREGE